jgi:hypothetical protein
MAESSRLAAILATKRLGAQAAARSSRRRRTLSAW